MPYSSDKIRTAARSVLSSGVEKHCLRCARFAPRSQRYFPTAESGIIHVAPKRLIVQTWRSANWATTAIDSVLTLSFWPEKDGARIELVHVNVPEEDFAGVSQGWEKYYWTPWRALLNAETKR